MGKTIFDFSNQVAVITGAALGIGKRSAERFAESGAKVFLIDIDKKGGAAAAQEIQGRGGDATFVECDVTDAASVKHAFETVMNKAGRIDILVNSAGGFHLQLAIIDTPEEGMGRRYRPEPEERLSHGEGSHPHLSETAERAHHQPGVDGGAHHLQPFLSPLFSRQGGGSLPSPGSLRMSSANTGSPSTPLPRGPRPPSGLLPCGAKSRGR